MTRVELADLADVWARVSAITALAEAPAAPEGGEHPGSPPAAGDAPRESSRVSALVRLRST